MTLPTLDHMASILFNAYFWVGKIPPQGLLYTSPLPDPNEFVGELHPYESSSQQRDLVTVTTIWSK